MANAQNLIKLLLPVIGSNPKTFSNSKRRWRSIIVSSDDIINHSFVQKKLYSKRESLQISIKLDKK